MCGLGVRRPAGSSPRLRARAVAPGGTGASTPGPQVEVEPPFLTETVKRKKKEKEKTKKEEPSKPGRWVRHQVQSRTVWPVETEARTRLGVQTEIQRGVRAPRVPSRSGDRF